MFRIILKNSLGCIIDQREAEDEEAARNCAINLITGLGSVEHGDKLEVIELED